MKIRHGYIPTDITYIFSAESKVTNRWAGAVQEEQELTYTNVLPIFVADPSNEKAISNCRYYANQRCSVWNPNTRKTEIRGVVQEINRENLPMEGLRVVGTQHSQNGLVFTVVDSNNYFFEMSHDVLLEALNTTGIQPGGILPGKFIWAVVERVIKPVRIGSSLYNSLLESGERLVLSNIPKNKLIPGGVYQDRQGNYSLYLGLITTEKWGIKYSPSRSGSKHTLAIRGVRKAMLWIDNIKKPAVITKESLSKIAIESIISEYFTTKCKIKTSHQNIKLIDSAELPISEYVKLLQEKASIKYIKELTTRPVYTLSKERLAIFYAPYCLARSIGASAPTVNEPLFQKLQTIRDKEL